MGRKKSRIIGYPLSPRESKPGSLDYRISSKTNFVALATHRTNHSSLGLPSRIMDEGTTNPWGWIVNIISAGGAITGILAILAWIMEDDFNPVLFGISAVGGILILIVLLNVHGTDGDKQRPL